LCRINKNAGNWRRFQNLRQFYTPQPLFLDKCYTSYIAWPEKPEKMLTKIWFAPSFSTLIQNRTEGLALVGVGTLQIGLQLAGLPGWACPFKSLFGIPCPGCGLTAATGQLFHGQWLASLHTHAFAPLFVFAFLAMAVVLFLPEKRRESIIAWIARFEQQTGITSLILASLLIYWVTRLAGLV
jgi:hypothetical protein